MKRPTHFVLTAKECRELRRLASRILRLVPDPDAPIHAADGDDTLCRRGGEIPNVTDDPDAVTCGACRGMASKWVRWVRDHA